MTTVTNEMICGDIDSTLENINLTGDMKVSKEGVLTSISGGSIYDTSNVSDPKRFIGSYNIAPDPSAADKRSIYVNVSDISMLSLAAEAINAMVVELEDKYAA